MSPPFSATPTHPYQTRLKKRSAGRKQRTAKTLALNRLKSLATEKQKRLVNQQNQAVGSFAIVLEDLNSTGREHLAAQRQGTSERGSQEVQNTPENVAKPQNTQQHEPQPSLSSSDEFQQQVSHQQELQQQQSAQQQHQAQHGGLELNQPISATFAQALGDFFHHVNVSNVDSHDFLQLGADDTRHNRELQTMLQWFRDLRNAHREPSLLGHGASNAGHKASNAGHKASNAAARGHDTTQGQSQATPGTSQQAAPTDQGQWSANHVVQQASMPGTSAAPVAPTFDDLQHVMDELQSLQNQLAAAKAEILASSQQIDANQSAIQQVCNAMASILSKLNRQWTTLNDTAKTMHQYVHGYFSSQ